jgi:uncharacterized protein (DUF305 family)
MGTGAAVVAAGLLLAGCSGTDDHTSGTHTSSSAAASTRSTAHNDADVIFAHEMIAHHQQAIAMARLVPSRSTNSQVKDLASQIEKAQDPEIQQMTGWLSQWAAASSMPTMDHGSMPGMMSDADMQKLQQAGGAEFDKMFLQMMVSHHQGAVDMAKTELATGADGDAKALAQSIIDAQTAQITKMQQMLASL